MLGQDVVRIRRRDRLHACAARRDRRDAVREAISAPTTSSSTAPRGPTSTAPRSTRTRRCAINRDGARNVAEAAGAVRLRLERLRLRRHQGRAVPRVGPGQPAVRLRAHQARRRARDRRGQPAPPHRRAPRGCSAPAARTSSRRCSALGRGEVRVVDDQVGCPTFTGHLAEALSSSPQQRRLRRPPRRRLRLVLVVRVRARDLRARPGSRYARRALHHRRVPAPGAPARLLGARAASAATHRAARLAGRASTPTWGCAA